MTLRRLLLTLASSLLFCSTSSIGLAQTAGQITGTVADPSGAAIASVQVVATEADRGTSQTTVTDVKGKYSFPALQTGRYNITFTLAGFKTGSLPRDGSYGFSADRRLPCSRTLFDRAEK